MCRWDDLDWNVKPFSEVIDSLVGQGVVVVQPRELSLDVSLRRERLADLDDLKVRNVRQFQGSGSIEVLLRHEDTILEQLLVNLSSVLLWHQH